MNTEVNESKSPDRAWLRAMAEAEDRSESVSVGGLAQSLGIPRALGPEMALPVLGHLIQLARRSRRLTIENLAQEAKVPLGDLVSIESDEQVVPDPRTALRRKAP